MKHKTVEGILIPSTLNFNNSSSFFANLLEINKKNLPPVSGRSISKKLGWPASFIIDLIKKRKTLNIQRTSEFIRFAKLKNIEAERLFWMAISESGDHFTKFYFEKKLSEDASELLLPTQDIADENLYFYIDTVSSLLLLKKKMLSVTEICKSLNIKNIDKKKIKEARDYIFNQKLLVWDEDKQSFVMTKNINFDNHDERDKTPFKGIKIHEHFATNFLSFVNSPRIPSCYNSGYVLLQKHQFLIVAKQLLLMRNWLLDIHSENQTLSPQEELRLMQFDINLFKITKE